MHVASALVFRVKCGVERPVLVARPTLIRLLVIAPCGVAVVARGRSPRLVGPAVLQWNAQNPTRSRRD